MGTVLVLRFGKSSLDISCWRSVLGGGQGGEGGLGGGFYGRLQSAVNLLTQLGRE